MTRLNTLLLAVDASPYAETAARYAAFFSRQLKLPLEALYVLDSRAAGSPAPFDVGMDDTNDDDAAVRREYSGGLRGARR